MDLAWITGKASHPSELLPPADRGDPGSEETQGRGRRVERLGLKPDRPLDALTSRADPRPAAVLSTETRNHS